ncbi:hypothetical protein TWF730_003338 [Orbilia blumenaviensis]|uniref:Large ribosomal subunit protein bL21m n=1 Tax=Orbilia blumenaviensis TaxID=1796055 RepID=A0AAV9U6M0_9PEZI
MSILPALSRRALPRLTSSSTPLIARPLLLSTSRLTLPPPSQIRHTSTTTSTTTTATTPPPPPPPQQPLSTSPPPPPQQPQEQDLTTLKRLHTALLHQPPWYTTIHIHNTPYLVTLGDRITLPSLLYPPVSPSTNPLNKPLQPGDIIRLTHASTLGSREYTIKGTPYIDERLFRCKAVVVEVTSEPMRIKEKTKRRQRRVKKVKSKHRYTVLRICELEVNELPEGLGEGTA